MIPIYLFDRYGSRIDDDDVITDGSNYYRVYWNIFSGCVVAVSGAVGYLRDTSADNLSKFVRVGTYEQCRCYMDGY